MKSAINLYYKIKEKNNKIRFIPVDEFDSKGDMYRCLEIEVVDIMDNKFFIKCKNLDLRRMFPMIYDTQDVGAYGFSSFFYRLEVGGTQIYTQCERVEKGLYRADDKILCVGLNGCMEYGHLSELPLLRKHSIQPFMFSSRVILGKRRWTYYELWDNKTDNLLHIFTHEFKAKIGSYQTDNWYISREKGMTKVSEFLKDDNIKYNNPVIVYGSPIFNRMVYS